MEIFAYNDEPDYFNMLDNNRARMALTDRAKASQELYITDFDGVTRKPANEEEFQNIYDISYSTAEYPAQISGYGYSIPPATVCQQYSGLVHYNFADKPSETKWATKTQFICTPLGGRWSASESDSDILSRNHSGLIFLDYMEYHWHINLLYINQYLSNKEFIHKLVLILPEGISY